MRYFWLSAPLLILAAELLSMPPAGAQNDAASLFKAQCSGCHGGDGRGNTPAGKSAKIHDLHSADVQNQSDAQLAEIITVGIRSSRGLNYSMPSHRDFTEDQIKRLVRYIRNLPAK